MRILVTMTVLMLAGIGVAQPALSGAEKAAAAPLPSQSFYTQKLDDPKAVTVTDAKGDGQADDTAAIQAALDKVQAATRYGVVLLPEGKYKITKTITVWPGVRLIGYGKNRPVLILADETPGYQEGEGKYMVWLCGGKARDGSGIREGTPGTFYSAFSNIDIKIGDGNPAAIGIRFHVAQHCYVSHVDFHIGLGKCGMQQASNEAHDLHFYGGEYGIITATAPPSWPFLLADSTFEGQRKAGINTIQNGMTLVRVTFKNEPTAVAVTPDRWESLWMKDCRLEDISGPAVLIGEESKARSRYNFEGLVCKNVPVLVAAPSVTKTGSGAVDMGAATMPDVLPKFETRVAAPGPIYEVKQYGYGLQYKDVTAKGEFAETREMAALEKLPAPVPSDIAPLGDPATWVNVTTLGLVGDNTTDNTEALRAAIAKHKVLYFPTGRYVVKDTIVLGPDTVLVGLHPMMTQILLKDNTAGYNGEGGPKALIESPKGGRSVICGIGLDAGYNTRAVAAKWMAGKDSMMMDVKFVGGHGTNAADGSGISAYNKDRTGDPDPAKKWDSQPSSLWVTDGGGGTFIDIWSAASYAHAGVEVTDTTTPGRMYAVSVEHHCKVEVIFKNAANWAIYALQTEEEKAEGSTAFSTDIENSKNLTFANLWLFRVTIPTKSPFGVRVKGGQDLNFRGVRTYSPSNTAYDNPFFDVTKDLSISTPEIGWLRILGK
jgi:hypothetical protein